LARARFNRPWEAVFGRRGRKIRDSPQARADLAELSSFGYQNDFRTTTKFSYDTAGYRYQYLVTIYPIQTCGIFNTALRTGTATERGECSAESHVPEFVAAGCTASWRAAAALEAPRGQIRRQLFSRDVFMFAAKPILILHEISNSKQTFVAAITLW
jgi:hypothetical protein